MISTKISPPNSLVLVMDPSIGQIPDSMSGSLVASTSTCIAIGTLSEHDGVTHVSLSDSPDVAPNVSPTFDGVLETPGNRIAVCSVLDEVILENKVTTSRTRVRIWANDPMEPSEIHIVVTSGDAGSHQKTES